MALRHAILGLLSIQPMSGYELKKAIDNSVNHFWTADQSQIYRTLSGLVDDGLATRDTALHDDRPNSHPHSLTDSGSAELDRWLASPLVTVPARETFLVRLFFADRLPIAEIRRLVAARRQERSEALAALEVISIPDRSDDITSVLRQATLANGITHMRAELAWLDDLDKRLDRFDR